MKRTGLIKLPDISEIGFIHRHDEIEVLQIRRLDPP